MRRGVGSLPYTGRCYHCLRPLDEPDGTSRTHAKCSRMVADRKFRERAAALRAWNGYRPREKTRDGEYRVSNRQKDPSRLKLVRTHLCACGAIYKAGPLAKRCHKCAVMAAREQKAASNRRIKARKKQ